MNGYHSVLIKRIAELSRPMLPEPAGVPARLSALPGIKAVLLDIYGTLLTCGHGEVGAAGAENSGCALEALRESGFRPVSERVGERAAGLLKCRIDETHASLKLAGVEYPEVDIREIWARVLLDLEAERLVEKTAGSSEAAHRRKIERLAVEYECRVNPAWHMPGLRETLETFRKLRVVTGIVSNAQFYTPLLFEALPETDWRVFDGNLCVLSFELREAKPSIRLFKTALDSLAGHHQCSPAETLFVGNDMLNDMMPAALAGCRTALFAGDARSLRLRRNDERCADIEPDIVVTSLTQLPDIIHGSVH